MTTDRSAEPDHEGTRLAEILASRIAPGMASPSPVSPAPSAEDTEPAGGTDVLAEMKAATAAVHVPGPRRMIGRQATRRDCLGCGEPWPCEHSWQARAEDAEAKLARVEELARQLTTATHPTIGGTFAASIGHKFLAITGSKEEARDA